MARARSEQILVRRFDAGSDRGRGPAEVLVEEPLEIRVADELRATTMRTPGHDFELAAGWCWAEGLLSVAPREVRYCATGSAADTGFNVVSVDPGPASLARGEGLAASAPRLGLASSSCGICGAEQVEALTARLEPLDPPARQFESTVLGSLGERMAEHQELFRATGGSHAAAAATATGDVVAVREDIGRHNAVDKVVGRLLLDDSLPAVGLVLWVSGRASFEIVQKAWAAGFGALVSVGAPSALSVRTATTAGLVLAAFARDGRCTVYAGDQQVDARASVASQTPVDGAARGSR